MTYAHVDDKTRVTLTRKIVDAYGSDFVIVPAKDEIILIPIAKDAIKALQEEGKKIPKGLTIKQLKKMMAEEAEKEALDSVRKKR